MVLVMGALTANAQRTPIKVSDLPKAVADSVTKNYAGYTFKETTKIISNNVTTFEVVISKGNTQRTVTFNSDGKTLKKMDVKSGIIKQSPKPSPKAAAIPHS
jgi:hypothetical protein